MHPNFQTEPCYLINILTVLNIQPTTAIPVWRERFWQQLSKSTKTSPNAKHVHISMFVCFTAGRDMYMDRTFHVCGWSVQFIEQQSLSSLSLSLCHWAQYIWNDQLSYCSFSQQTTAANHTLWQVKQD